ncbi:hypothetical protein [Adhaeribacter aquaticus]|uniref:hypothetical protein n=1 Tax=Adhaeribacter aquaticus TaxID=299567 RepID=UPI00042904EF|nr:hypothetical protein [Adhaeribacter aquaticus]
MESLQLLNFITLFLFIGAVIIFINGQVKASKERNFVREEARKLKARINNC